MAVSRPVEAAIFSAMFVALDIRGLETGARLPKNVKTSRAIVLYGNRLAVDMDRLRECLGSDDAATALDLANPYPVKLGRHMESSFSAATWYIGADWQRVIDDFHPPDEPLTVESVAETLPGLLAEMRSRSDVTFKEISIQLEKEFRRAAGRAAPVVESRETDGASNGALSAEARAVGLLTQHPEWTDTKIAEEVGISRTSLYRFDTFTKAREALVRSGVAKWSNDVFGAETATRNWLR